ncbi:hypothetical protein [Variovorax saccharolyticus]|uniref:hypothetical protein n=1 Tax=Variovorax saccharolyticus TaxID=3053516 RepID=UPI0025790581|nr:hypothetical protein [Variovorax sp. J31P216]MDM0030191.1 hypothetical protein [Variovorax sp. J31P216]
MEVEAEVEVHAASQPDESWAAQGARALCCACATVPVFNQDTEAPVLGQQLWEAVHEGRAQGQSISAISRELELDRKTVRTCLQQASWQPYRRAEGDSLLNPHREWLAQRAPQVNHAARILWQELRAQRGFTGSYVIVRRAVAPPRLAASVAALTQCRFETGPACGSVGYPPLRPENHHSGDLLGTSLPKFELEFDADKLVVPKGQQGLGFVHHECLRLFARMMRAFFFVATLSDFGVFQWQNGTFPSFMRGFDSLHSLQLLGKGQLNATPTIPSPEQAPAAQCR